MDNSKIFDQKFDALFPQILETGFMEKAAVLGGVKRESSLLIDFFNRQIALSKEGVYDTANNDITFAVKTVLCQYILRCPDQIISPTNRLVTFRELSNAGPLFSSFTQNTSKIIETTFTGRLMQLKDKCVKMKGAFMESGSYDLSVRFLALPRVPVILNFNDEDEMMPATAVFLYHDNADQYLDLECLTVTGTYLTGQLIGSS